MSGSSLNLKQVFGGATIKQGDTNTRLAYELLDKNNGPMYSDIMSEVDDVSVKVVLTELKSKTSIIITNATVKTGTVIFTMPAETTPGRYDVEVAVTVKGQTAIFPSSYASVVIEIVKSYLMARPDDSDVKYINLGTLPTSDDISKIQTQLAKLQEEIKNVGAGGSVDQSEDISRIDAELKALQATIKGLPTKEVVDDGLRVLTEEIKDAQSKIQANALNISKTNERSQNTTKQLDGLYNKIGSMATKEDLDGKLESTDLEPINTSIQSLETSMKSKVDASSLEPINTSIESLETAMESKASKEDLDIKLAEAKPNVGVISESQIDYLFAFKPYPANGLYPSPDNYLRVWVGEELITEIDSPEKVEEEQFFQKLATRVELPSSVTTIGLLGFANNYLTSLTIPNSVTRIEDGAFGINQLTSVTIPNSVAIIMDSTFMGNQLTSVTIPNSVTLIGKSAFERNQLTSVTIPNSVTLIGENAFESNQLTSVTIPNSVTRIGENAFNSNQLTSVTIPNSVTSIEEGTFAGNQLTSVTIPDSVTRIGRGAFERNQLTSVTIPNSVTSIEDGAFMNSQLTSVTIPDSVTRIGRGAFNGNKLTSVTIPDSVTSIEEYAFNSSPLKTVSISRKTTFKSNSFPETAEIIYRED